LGSHIKEKLNVAEIAGATSTSGEDLAAAPEGAAPVVPATVEEAEAIWQKRVSNRDKAHNAEVAELRRQLVALQTGAPPESATVPTAEQVRIKELETQIAVEKRKVRFPHAAEDLGDDIATVDEVRLARLEARLAAEDAAPAPRMDPNSAGRGAPGAPKPLSEMSKEELLAQLKGLSPQYEEYLRSIR
jgi:hypothetical protein